MSKQKLRVANTELDNLVSNLRGEVGEIITTWVLMHHLMSQARELSTDDPAKDMANESLSFVMVLVNKLEDELVARLSELGEEKVGRLNFYFAAVKLNQFEEDAVKYTRLVSQHKLRDKRNRDISHKELPERWTDHRHFAIPYRSVLKATAAALRLMKRIDRFVIGPAAPYLWRETRKRRYNLMGPPSAGYLIVPYMNLSEEDRLRIVVAELQEGRKEVWSPMPTTVNGSPATVLVSREWGVIALGDRLLALAHYPLQQLSAINFGDPVESAQVQDGQAPEAGGSSR